MRINLVLADTGRQTAAGLSLLQVGWKATVAIPAPGGGFTLPEQAVVAFIDAEFGEVNHVYEAHLTLLNDEEETQHFQTPGGLITAEVHRQILIPQVPGASVGSDSLASVLFCFPAGGIRIGGVPGRYKWTCQVADTTGEISFRVNQQPTMPTFGSTAAAGGA
jgi:hypothetical protein